VRADIHDGQEHKPSMQGPDTEAQDQSSPNHHIRLATHGRSSEPHLIDHLIGACDKGVGNCQPDRFSRAFVQNQLKPACLNYGEIATSNATDRRIAFIATLAGHAPDDPAIAAPLENDRGQGLSRRD
jgi:hypothetical protein